SAAAISASTASMQRSHHGLRPVEGIQQGFEGFDRLWRWNVEERWTKSPEVAHDVGTVPKSKGRSNRARCRYLCSLRNQEWR
ncbi:hypothetical protein THAOC_16513, partial [Thalassiosira oceanica]